MIGGEKLIDNYTLAERRGREAYIQIRVKINDMRARGLEPKAIWVNTDTSNDMKALWHRACGIQFDGRLPYGVAGVPMYVGSTGGADYLLECYDSQADAERMRNAHKFAHVDNPLAGTH